MKPIATFSIVAFSLEEMAWGIAVASKFPGIGAVVPWAEAGAGVVATQSYANTSYGPQGLTHMRSGLGAQETLDLLLADDEDKELRQVGLVDANGKSASFTGSKCLPWAGGRVGPNYAVQGNILTGEETITAMAETFESSEGNLPNRLFAALLAGDRAGGDKRGRQSAAIYVVKNGGGYGGYNDRWFDCRIDDHDDPVPRLGELIELQELHFGGKSDVEKLTIVGSIAHDLQGMMQRLHYYDGALTGIYDDATRAALRIFIGNENFEDRIDFDKGLIDKPVFEFLRNKFFK
ncbi:MAG: DUF1028 domain-containing protein [Chloroflexi bacterium]|nr:DUF1028 domain-containing protein [Chloroflexota bacterium]